MHIMVLLQFTSYKNSFILLKKVVTLSEPKIYLRSILINNHIWNAKGHRGWVVGIYVLVRIVTGLITQASQPKFLSMLTSSH